MKRLSLLILGVFMTLSAQAAERSCGADRDCPQGYYCNIRWDPEAGFRCLKQEKNVVVTPKPDPEESFERLTLGAANLECQSSEVAVLHAQDMARAAALEACGVFAKKEIEVLQTDLLASYRGSCWAGTPSGAAVRMRYRCK